MGLLLHRLRQLLYPENADCLLCGVLMQENGLCEDCRSRLALSRLEESHHEGGDAWHSECYSVWKHEGAARELVHLLKFNGVKQPASILADGMAEVIRPIVANMQEPPLVTWVTMPDSRYRERYYDHARLLAEEVAARLKLPCRCMLRRIETGGELRHQVGLSAQERLTNLRGTIDTVGEAPACVLLIDDVLTTGATAALCTEALHSVGAEHVITLTATRADQATPK